MKKYNNINKEDVLRLFEVKTIVKRADVCEAYNCSVYSVRAEMEELIDLKKIRISKYGYKLIKN